MLLCNSSPNLFSSYKTKTLSSLSSSLFPAPGNPQPTSCSHEFDSRITEFALSTDEKKAWVCEEEAFRTHAWQHVESSVSFKCPAFQLTISSSQLAQPTVSRSKLTAFLCPLNRNHFPTPLFLQNLLLTLHFAILPESLNARLL